MDLFKLLEDTEFDTECADMEFSGSDYFWRLLPSFLLLETKKTWYKLTCTYSGTHAHVLEY